MYVDFFQAPVHGQFQHGENVVFVAVYAAGGEQAEYMQRLAAVAGTVNGIGQGEIVEKRSSANGAADAGKFLIDDAARAQAHVSHFGVAHLSARQAHCRFRGVNQCIGIGCPQLIPGRGVGAGDGVVFPVGPVTPAIHDQQNQRFVYCCHSVVPEDAPREGRLNPPFSHADTLLARVRQRCFSGKLPAPEPATSRILISSLKHNQFISV